MRIGIDPGHGGRDPGAIGPTRLYEKDVTLGISLELGRLLKEAGLEPVLTRADDRAVELVTRTALLNNQKCDLALSVHCNSVTDPKPNYFAVFVHGLGGEAEKLAHRVIEKVTAATGWSWGADDDGIREKNLHITRETRMPAILVECGFISNPEQEKQLRQPEFQKKLARAIAAGVLTYLGIVKGDDVVTVDEALKILVNQGVINSPDYWHNASECVKYLDTLIINMAKKLQGVKI